jgi:hypothetical protein
VSHAFKLGEAGIRACFAVGIFDQPRERWNRSKYYRHQSPRYKGEVDIQMEAHAETDEWRALEQLVSDLSEQAFYASWEYHGEFRVWRLATEGGSWGRITSEDSADQLKEALAISRRLGIWVVFDDETDFVKPIPIEAWLRSYERWRAGISPEP